MKCLFPFETFPKRHFYAAVSVFLGLGALLGVILLPVSFSMGQERGNPSADGKIVTLPGVKVDLRRRIIDIEAVVCLDEGPLELIACGRGSKEHESIVSLASRAMHIHTALLLIGAVNGHPASRRQLLGDDAEWEWVSPQGDEIEVWMVLPSKCGPLAERPISEFVVKTKELLDEVDGQTLNSPEDRRRLKEGKVESLTHRFLFAGSILRDNRTGTRQYLADLSGNYISIATFGDELLCLPSLESKSNDALSWQIKPDSLPAVGTAVQLRLKFKKKNKDSETSPMDRSGDCDKRVD